MKIECPNFDQCGGEHEYSIEAWYDGADEWSTFRGYIAEPVDQSCECELTAKQYEALEREALEADADYGGEL